MKHASTEHVSRPQATQKWLVDLSVLHLSATLPCSQAHVLARRAVFCMNEHKAHKQSFLELTVNLGSYICCVQSTTSPLL